MVRATVKRDGHRCCSEEKHYATLRTRDVVSVVYFVLHFPGETNRKTLQRHYP